MIKKLNSFKGIERIFCCILMFIWNCLTLYAPAHKARATVPHILSHASLLMLLSCASFLQSVNKWFRIYQISFTILIHAKMCWFLFLNFSMKLAFFLNIVYCFIYFFSYKWINLQKLLCDFVKFYATSCLEIVEELWLQFCWPVSQI